MSNLKPSWVQLNQVVDPVGELSILELPFGVKRLYYIQKVPLGGQRGFHAHKSLHQIFLAAQGSLTLELITPKSSETFELNATTDKALHVPPGYWRVMSNFSSDAICLVLASEHYDEADYIRNFEEYVSWYTQVVDYEG
jgi:dTDP-4-dehydrorhamnose 3,5-epimerase-like enzyme